MQRSKLIPWLALLTLTLVGFQNCGPVSQTTQSVAGVASPESSPNAYFSTTERVVLEIYYEPGAEPYSGVSPQGRQLWGILEENLEAIFQFRTTRATLFVPKALDDMNALPAQSRSTWSTQDLLNLHIGHYQSKATPQEARFYIYFLKGHYSSNGTAQTNVIGVNVGGTPVIGMFKDVIRDSGANKDGLVARFVEQSTLVHEMGHALGFVNNGVPMATPHQDTEHGAHTLNADCVMYWQNEGIADMRQFVQKYLLSTTTVMWGPEVLADAKAFSQ